MTCILSKLKTTSTMTETTTGLNNIFSPPPVIIFHFTLLTYHSNKNAIGVTIIIVKIVRSIQIIISLGTLIGISVDKITGIVAEKNNIADTETVAMTNLVMSGASTTSNAGKNISAISIDAALAASIGSGTCIIHVNGKNIYPKMSKVMVNSANTNPNRPTDKIEGNVAAAIKTPSRTFIQIFLYKTGACLVALIASSIATLKRLSFIISSGSP